MGALPLPSAELGFAFMFSATATIFVGNILHITVMQVQ